MDDIIEIGNIDIAQRGDIAEVIIYTLLKNLGLNILTPTKNSDDRGLDFHTEIDEFDLKIQVKSVSCNNVNINNTHVRYNLKSSNNNLLFDYNTGNNPYRKGILLLIIIPEEINNFLTISEEEFILTCKLFWYKDFERTENESTINIRIPILNKLTSNTLSDNIGRWLT